MNTIILILETIIFLLIAVAGIVMIRINFGRIPTIAMMLFLLGIVGIFYLGSTFFGEGLFIKETVCSYTVGKSNLICSDFDTVNYNYQFQTISDKIGLVYIITDVVLVICMIREFFLMIWHMGDCIRRND